MLRSPDPAASQGVEWALRHVGVKNCLDFCCEFKILFRLCVRSGVLDPHKTREGVIFYWFVLFLTGFAVLQNIPV